MNKYIYEITNKITNSKYIGLRSCACDINKDKFKGENTILDKEFKKYGKKQFDKRILAVIPADNKQDILLEIYLNSIKATFIEEIQTEEKSVSSKNLGASNGVSKKVICLTNGKDFDTLTLASKYAGVCRSSISKACSNISGRYAGKDPETSERLEWMYYDEYIAQKEGVEYIREVKTRRKNQETTRVRCITTGEEFDSIKEASEFYKTNGGSISNACALPGYHAGKDPDTDEPLEWEYLD